MSLDRVERARVVNEEDTCVAPRRLQMFQHRMQESGDSVVHAPPMAVGELQRVQVVLDKGEEAAKNKLLQAFHREGGEGNGPVMVQLCGLGFFGDGDYGAGFPKRGDVTGIEGLLVDGLEGRGEFLRACAKCPSRNAVRTASLWLHFFQFRGS